MIIKNFPNRSVYSIVRQRTVDYFALSFTLIISTIMIWKGEKRLIITGIIIIVYGLLQFLYSLYRRRYFIKEYKIFDDKIELSILKWNTPIISGTYSKDELVINSDQDPWSRFESSRIKLTIDKIDYTIIHDRYWKEMDAKAIQTWYTK